MWPRWRSCSRVPGLIQGCRMNLNFDWFGLLVFGVSGAFTPPLPLPPPPVFVSLILPPSHVSSTTSLLDINKRPARVCFLVSSYLSGKFTQARPHQWVGVHSWQCAHRQFTSQNLPPRTSRACPDFRPVRADKISLHRPKNVQSAKGTVRYAFGKTPQRAQAASVSPGRLPCRCCPPSRSEQPVTGRSGRHLWPSADTVEHRVRLVRQFRPDRVIPGDSDRELRLLSAGTYRLRRRYAVTATHTSVSTGRVSAFTMLSVRGATRTVSRIPHGCVAIHPHDYTPQPICQKVRSSKFTRGATQTLQLDQELLVDL